MTGMWLRGLPPSYDGTQYSFNRFNQNDSNNVITSFTVGIYHRLIDFLTWILLRITLANLIDFNGVIMSKTERTRVK